MKIVVGLGNPGRKYANTRHNMGYMVLEELASRYSIEKEESRFDAIIGHIRIGSEKVLLVKPLTYMNLSGKAVRPLVAYYKLELKDLIVIYDDMDLDPGIIRLRAMGGSGGHKGMKSIIEQLGSQEFPRLRIGIGRPEEDTIDWVLGHFGSAEKALAEEAGRQAADAVEYWIEEGIEKAMNKYN